MWFEASISSMCGLNQNKLCRNKDKVGGGARTVSRPMVFTATALFVVATAVKFRLCDPENSETHLKRFSISSLAFSEG